MQLVTDGFYVREDKLTPMLGRDKRHTGNRVIDPQYFDTKIDVELPLLDGGGHAFFHDPVNEYGIFD